MAQEIRFDMGQHSFVPSPSSPLCARCGMPFQRGNHTIPNILYEVYINYIKQPHVPEDKYKHVIDFIKDRGKILYKYMNIPYEYTKRAFIKEMDGTISEIKEETLTTTHPLMNISEEFLFFVGPLYRRIKDKLESENPDCTRLTNSPNDFGNFFNIENRKFIFDILKDYENNIKPKSVCDRGQECDNLDFTHIQQQSHFFWFENIYPTDVTTDTTPVVEFPFLDSFDPTSDFFEEYKLHIRDVEGIEGIVMKNRNIEDIPFKNVSNSKIFVSVENTVFDMNRTGKIDSFKEYKDYINPDIFVLIITNGTEISREYLHLEDLPREKFKIIFGSNEITFKKLDNIIKDYIKARCGMPLERGNHGIWKDWYYEVDTTKYLLPRLFNTNFNNYKYNPKIDTNVDDVVSYNENFFSVKNRTTQDIVEYLGENGHDEIKVMICGNPGRPGGAVTQYEQDTFNVNGFKLTGGGQEESIISSWLSQKEDGDCKKFYNLSRAWGLTYFPKRPISELCYGNNEIECKPGCKIHTIEDIYNPDIKRNYRMSLRENNTKIYRLSYILKDVKLTQNGVVDFIFSFGPNIGVSNIPTQSTARTYAIGYSDTPAHYSWFKESIKQALLSGLVSMAINQKTPGTAFAVIGFVGAGMYAGKQKERIQQGFEDIVLEILNTKTDSLKTEIPEFRSKIEVWEREYSIPTHLGLFFKQIILPIAPKNTVRPARLAGPAAGPVELLTKCTLNKGGPCAVCLRANKPLKHMCRNCNALNSHYSNQCPVAGPARPAARPAGPFCLCSKGCNQPQLDPSNNWFFCGKTCRDGCKGEICQCRGCKASRLSRPSRIFVF